MSIRCDWFALFYGSIHRRQSVDQQTKQTETKPAKTKIKNKNKNKQQVSHVWESARGETSFLRTRTHTFRSFAFYLVSFRSVFYSLPYAMTQFSLQHTEFLFGFYCKMKWKKKNRNRNGSIGFYQASIVHINVLFCLNRIGHADDGRSIEFAKQAKRKIYYELQNRVPSSLHRTRKSIISPPPSLLVANIWLRMVKHIHISPVTVLVPDHTIQYANHHWPLLIGINLFIEHAKK